jgi:hypothetical protein
VLVLLLAVLAGRGPRSPCRWPDGDRDGWGGVIADRRLLGSRRSRAPIAGCSGQEVEGADRWLLGMSRKVEGADRLFIGPSWSGDDFVEIGGVPAEHGPGVGWCGGAGAEGWGGVRRAVGIGGGYGRSASTA